VISLRETSPRYSRPIAEQCIGIIRVSLQFEKHFLVLLREYFNLPLLKDTHATAQSKSDGIPEQ